MPERIGLAEEKRQDWVVDLPFAHTLEDALDPGYWAHVAGTMQPGDHIELRAEDGSWRADLVVDFCERNYARVVLKHLLKMQADTQAPTTSIKHKVEWKGNYNRYCVIRTSDEKMLQSGFRTRAEADHWLTEHEKSSER